MTLSAQSKSGAASSCRHDVQEPRDCSGCIVVPGRLRSWAGRRVAVRALHRAGGTTCCTSTHFTAHVSGFAARLHSRGCSRDLADWSVCLPAEFAMFSCLSLLRSGCRRISVKAARSLGIRSKLDMSRTSQLLTLGSSAAATGSSSLSPSQPPSYLLPSVE